MYYVLSCGQERVMIFVWGGWGGAPVVPTIDDLLALLQVFVGIVEEFEEIRGFDRGEFGCSGVVLVWVIHSR